MGLNQRVHIKCLTRNFLSPCLLWNISLLPSLYEMILLFLQVMADRDFLSFCTLNMLFHCFLAISSFLHCYSPVYVVIFLLLLPAFSFSLWLSTIRLWYVSRCRSFCLSFLGFSDPHIRPSWKWSVRPLSFWQCLSQSTLESFFNFEILLIQVRN